MILSLHTLSSTAPHVRTKDIFILLTFAQHHIPLDKRFIHINYLSYFLKTKQHMLLVCIRIDTIIQLSLRTEKKIKKKQMIIFHEKKIWRNGIISVHT